MRMPSPQVGTATAAEAYVSRRRPILVSKIAVPPPPPGLVDRPRLRSRLDEAVEKPLVLVSAPAGWGKTTLLASWVRGGAAGHQAAWLTMEPADNVAGFWAYVRESVTRALVTGKPPPEEAGELPALGPDADGDYPSRLVASLGLIAAPVVLVIDDLHEVGDRRIIDGLDFLVRHVGGLLRLVLSTRADPPLPLRRWQVGGQLTELRASDLAFSPAESTRWLRHELPAEDDPRAAGLHFRTEGWPAGLRFAALTPSDAEDQGRSLDGFGGVHGPLAKYLREEVLARQPRHLLDAMLCTAVLDRVCGSLMDALTGKADGNQVLSDLDRANAFVVPLGGPDGWFRYHRLFGELLLAELDLQSPYRVRDLHGRAADWYARHGQPVETLHHALGAEDWLMAVGVLRGHWQELLACGRAEARRRVVPPPSDVALRDQPELALAYAVDRLNGGDPDDADGYLDIAVAGAGLLPAHVHDRFTLSVDAFRLVRAEKRGATAEVRSLAPRVLAGGSRATGTDTRAGDGALAIALTALGTAGPVDDDVDGEDAAEAMLSAALAAATRAGLTCQQAMCEAHLAVVRALRGRLRDAEESARSALGAPFSASGCLARSHGLAHLALAGVRFQQDQPDAGADHLESAVASVDVTAPPAAIALLALLRSWSLQGSGEPMEARGALLAGRRHLQDPASSGYLNRWLVAAEADLRTAYGDTAGARAVLAEPLRDGGAACAPLSLALGRARLHDGDASGALKVLSGWRSDPAAERTVSINIAGCLLEAVARSRVGADADASRLLESCLETAEAEGMRRVFHQNDPGLHELLVRHLDSGTAFWFTLDELVRTSHDPDRRGELATTLVTPLTERELSVLRYLPSVLSNAEIAGELSVSVHTVKTHLRNIFQKLEVTRRRDAVLRGRDLKLL
jgi:LuxR family transcriptional regulator, maltose regulon positive regulatory protein